MSGFKNVMQVFSLLDKSNCRKCGEKTCLAFASCVFKGERHLSGCPVLSPEVVARYSGRKAEGVMIDNSSEYLNHLKERIQDIDLNDAAARTGGSFNNNRLTIKILGKDCSVDQRGELYSDIHMIPWVMVPYLEYVLDCKGDEVSGAWVSLRELSSGRERYPLFQKRCEEGMKRIADVYTDLFDDMVHLFQGRQVESMFSSDISVVLPIFPKVPLMICYWKVEDGMASSLNIFFDRSADVNLGAGSAFTIGAGITQMFEKMALQHGFAVN